MNKDNQPGPSKRVKYGDKDYEETLLKWTEEVSSGESDIESDADFVPSDHDTDSEIEADEDFGHNLSQGEELQRGELDPSPSTNFWYGKNRYKWSKIPPFSKTTRTLKHNIVIKCPGLKNRGIYKEEPENVWNTLFDNNIIRIILEWTNKRMARIRLKYKNETKSDLRDLDVVEQNLNLS